MGKPLGEHGNKVMALEIPAQDKPLQALVTPGGGQGGQRSAQGHLSGGRIQFCLGFLGLTFPNPPNPNYPEAAGVTSLQCHDLPGDHQVHHHYFTSLFFMHLFIGGEILPQHVFLEEQEEEEAGPGVRNDHRPSQKVSVLQGEAKILKILLFPGLCPRICWR